MAIIMAMVSIANITAMANGMGMAMVMGRKNKDKTAMGGSEVLIPVAVKIFEAKLVRKLYIDIFLDHTLASG